MRIIAGRARGKRLQTFKGTATRPTSDRAREAIFSMLISRLESLNGLRVLDLFAGSGALALEAISRGAESAVLIEKQPKAIELIRANITQCGFDANCRLLPMTVEKALNQSWDKPFDLIFVDPPYGKGLMIPTLQQIKAQRLLTNDGMICAETEVGLPMDAVFGDLSVAVDRTYAQSRIRLLTHLC